MDKYALLFDSDRCVSCKRCVVVCRKENNIGDEWDRIFLTMRQATQDFASMEPFVEMCNHCDKPGCIEACPVDGKAIYKRPEDGIVLVEPEKCTGCGKCVTGCPYDMIHLSNWKNSKGQVIADKCTYCVHILDKLDNVPDDHMTPCVEVCPTGALEFYKKDQINEKIKWKGREDDIIDMRKGGLTPNNVYLKKRHVKKVISF
ncbi:MAG: 4Fe-4S dicluster domain-containing protein [Candidatus Anammoxibacter sp.]